MSTDPGRTNPFRPTFGVSPYFWAGRRVVLDDFAEALRRGPGAAARSLVVSGSRGIGKTALLNELEDLAVKEGWVVLSVSGRGNLVRLLVDSLIPEKIQELAPQTNRKVSGVSIAGLGSISTESKDPQRPVPTLDSRLRELLTHLDGTGVLITVDEVQDADRDDLSGIATTYQGLIRREANVALAMAGLTHGVDQLLQLPATTFLRRARRYALGPLTEKDATDVLVTTAADSQLPFTEEALHLASDIAQGYPYLVQLIGALAWDRADQCSASSITTEHVEAVREEAVMTLGAQVHYMSLLEIPESHRNYLVALAELGDGPQSTSVIAERLGRTTKSTSDARAHLIERDLIQAAGRGKVEFSLPYLAEWLRGPGTVRRVQ